jgi:hypothetical protein
VRENGLAYGARREKDKKMLPTRAAWVGALLPSPPMTGGIASLTAADFQIYNFDQMYTSGQIE